MLIACSNCNYFVGDMNNTCRVAAALGAGSSKRAITASIAACAAAPLLWLIVAAVLLEPHSQVCADSPACRPLLICQCRQSCVSAFGENTHDTLLQAFMLHIFTSGADGELVDRLRHLLSLVCILVLFEGCQIVLSGVVEVSLQTRSCNLTHMPKPHIHA